MILVVRRRYAVDVGKGITIVTQATGDQLRSSGHQLTREYLALLDQQQGLDLVFRHFQVTAELHLANLVFLTFGDVDGDIDVFLVRRDRNLGRGDIHVDIATVQVIGTQALQVTGKFFTSILVVVLEERQPVGGLEFEQIDQVFVGEYRVAHHVDVLDGGNGAFVDLDFQAYAIARLWHHFGLDLGGVAALGHVLTLEFVTNTFEGCALEDLTFGQTGLLQTLYQVVSRNGLVAFYIDTGHRRPLDHRDNQNVTVAPQLDILEKPGFEQRASGFHQAPIIRLLPNVQW